MVFETRAEAVAAKKEYNGVKLDGQVRAGTGACAVCEIHNKGYTREGVRLHDETA